jgi:hypothetical protein
MMVSNARVLVAVAVLGAAGAVHGIWTDRWRNAPELEQATARLDRVPLVIGDWQGVDQPMSPHEVEAAQLSGYVSRRYTNRITGQDVGILLMGGRPGPVAVHTPDICFTAAGYEMDSDPAAFTPPAAGGAPAELMTAIFTRKHAAAPDHLRTFWAWNARGQWEAPANPRLAFARYHALYKLYVVLPTWRPKGRPEDDPRTEFVGVLLRELNRALFEEPTPVP